MTIEQYKDSPLSSEGLKAVHKLESLLLAEYPNVEIKLAYGILGFYLEGKPVLYFGGFKNHLGVYALPTTYELFKSKLLEYKQGNGSVQFPYKDNVLF